MNAPESPAEPRLTSLSHGGGCGCKIAPGVLSEIHRSIFRVPDVDLAHAALKRSGAPILQPPTDQPWGARMLITRDPAGVTLFVSHPIPIAPELASSVDVLD